MTRLEDREFYAVRVRKSVDLENRGDVAALKSVMSLFKLRHIVISMNEEKTKLFLFSYLVDTLR